MTPYTSYAHLLFYIPLWLLPCYQLEYSIEGTHFVNASSSSIAISHPKARIWTQLNTAPAFTQSKFIFGVPISLNEYSGLLFNVGLESTRVSGGKPYRNPFLSSAIVHHSRDNLITFIGGSMKVSRRPIMDYWEARQLYTIDKTWSIGCGWRYTALSQHQLLLNANYIHKRIHLHILQQGSFTAIGCTLKREKWHFQCTLSNYHTTGYQTFYTP